MLSLKALQKVAKHKRNTRRNWFVELVVLVELAVLHWLHTIQCMYNVIYNVVQQLCVVLAQRFIDIMFCKTYSFVRHFHGLSVGYRKCFEAVKLTLVQRPCFFKALVMVHVRVSGLSKTFPYSCDFFFCQVMILLG